jgi:peptide/nickel transport system permease protein
VVGYLLRRLVWAVAIVVLVAVFAYGGIRALRPELYEGDTLVGGVAGDLHKLFIDRDFGRFCFMVGCPSANDIVGRCWTIDVMLILGTLVFGIAGGVAGGVWCATRPRSLAARFLEGTSTVLFCVPVYVVGFGLLLLFAPPFGLFPFQPLFELHLYISPFHEPVTFLRAMLIPWLVTAAPLAAVCLRLTLASIVEVEHEDYVRTALAKGLSREQTIRRHAAPSAYVPVASYVGAAMPLVVANMVLVEVVFNVPGVFRFVRKAVSGPDPPGPNPDYEALQTISIYAAVFIVLSTLLADIALAYLDPRVRTAGR